MKKFSMLVGAVTLPLMLSQEADARQGFYVEGSIGSSHNHVEVTNDAPKGSGYYDCVVSSSAIPSIVERFGALPRVYIVSDTGQMILNPMDNNNPYEVDCFSERDAMSLGLYTSNGDLKKSVSKANLTAGVGAGYEWQSENGFVIIGCGLQFEKRFGKQNKKFTNWSVYSYDKNGVKTATISGLSDGALRDDAGCGFEYLTINGRAEQYFPNFSYANIVPRDCRYKCYDSSREFQLSFKNKLSVTIDPTITFMVTKKFGVVLGVGYKFQHNKYTLTQTDNESEVYSKSKSIHSPVLTGGFRFNFTDRVFFKLLYTRTRGKANIKYDDVVSRETRWATHKHVDNTVKACFGFKI